MKLQNDLREFIVLLNSLKVDYLIVGGHAVAFHGYPRFTGDIDFFVRPTLENAERLVSVLRAFGFTDPGLVPETFSQPRKVVQLGVPPNRIDLLTRIDGVSFEEAWAGRIESELDSMPVNFIGKAELVKNKRTAGRSKDNADVEKLDPDPRTNRQVL